MRFRDREALLAAVRERCEKEFSDAFGRAWTPSLHRRYWLDPRTKSDDDEAGKLLARLQQLMVHIDGFRKSPAVRRLATRGEAPFRTKVLFDWAESHRVLLGKFPRWEAEALSRRLDTPRKRLIRRVLEGGPQFFDRLKAKEGINARHLAVISMLSGNVPTIDEHTLTSAGFTAAEIIDLEAKYMRKALADR